MRRGRRGLSDRQTAILNVMTMSLTTEEISRALRSQGQNVSASQVSESLERLAHRGLVFSAQGSSAFQNWHLSHDGRRAAL